MLYGRAAEQAELDRLIAGACAGNGGVLVIRGEAGAGKTALIEHAAGAADGLRVLRAAGHAGEAEQPFASLELLLRPVRDHVGELAGPQALALRSVFESGESGASGDQDRFLVRRAVLSLLSGRAAERPLLCLVDDCQWLDPASADVLAFAARRFGVERVALVIAGRDGGPFPSCGLPELRLGGLSPAASTAYLRARTPALAAPAVDLIAAEAEGNPLALRELAAAMTAAQRNGRINPVGCHDGAHTVVSAVQEEFRVGLAELPGPTRTLLLVAAADHTRDLTRVSVAAEALGVGIADLGNAERAGFLQVAGSAVTFPHPLMRAAAYHYGTTAERRAVHRALAEGHVDRAESHAWHRAAATAGHDETVAAGLADVASRSGGWQAYAGYARAAELTPDRETRAHRLAAAARAASQAGLLGGAAELAATAARLTGDPVIRAELAQVSAAVEFERGSPRVAGRTLIDGAALIEDSDPAEALIMLAEAIRCGWHVADTCLLREAETAMRAVPLPPGSPLASLAPAMSAVVSSLPGSTPDSDGQVCALAKAARHSLPADLSRRLMATSIGLAVGSGGGLDNAVHFVAECRDSAATGRLPYALQLLAYGQLYRGDYTGAAASAAEGLELAAATGQLHRASQLRCVLGWLAAIQGDEDRCAALVVEGTDYAAAQGIKPTLALGGWALALLDLGLGRNQEALARLEGLAFGDSNMGTILRAPDLVEAAMRCGQPMRARGALFLLEQWVLHSGHLAAAAVALRCRALTSAPSKAKHYFADAIVLHGKAKHPYAEARTELAYGEWLRRARHRAEARPHLKAAAEAFKRLGATPWTARALAELEATGDPALVSPGSLTPQELQVVRLAAAGASNKDIAGQLFLSPRTVGNHLYRAFRKLGIKTRADLAGLDLG